MKRVPLMLLIMALVSFATVGFADNSPPGVEISTSYEMPEGINLNIEIQTARVWQTIELRNEGRIAVPDCDLKFWPTVENANYNNSNNIASINFIYNDVRCRLFGDKNEVLSLFEQVAYS